jgi:hypothetical protein
MDAFQLEQAALRLYEVDREIVGAVLNMKFDIADELVEEFRSLKRDIQIAQIHSHQLAIGSQEALTVLRQVRDGEPFHTERIFKVRNDAGDTFPLDELTEEEIDDLGSDLFYAWFSRHEYVQSLYRLGTLLVTANVPSRVLGYMSEARQCYAFQQYNAVLSLCRTFIEATVRDICEQLGIMGTGPDAPLSVDERRFSPLAGAISKGKLRRRINQLYYGLASPVVHGVRSVSAEDARRAIKETLSLAEDLYREHGLGTTA